MSRKAIAETSSHTHQGIVIEISKVAVIFDWINGSGAAVRSGRGGLCPPCLTARRTANHLTFSRQRSFPLGWGCLCPHFALDRLLRTDSNRPKREADWLNVERQCLPVAGNRSHHRGGPGKATLPGGFGRL